MKPEPNDKPKVNQPGQLTLDACPAVVPPGARKPRKAQQTADSLPLFQEITP